MRYTIATIEYFITMICAKPPTDTRENKHKKNDSKNVLKSEG